MAERGMGRMQLRHELKYRLTAADTLPLLERLHRVMRYDPFNAASQGKYEVYSLYYDTPHDKALREKQSGVACREKFRLRYYGNNDRVIHLEKKFKREGMTGKIQGSMTKDECMELLKGTGDDGFMIRSVYPVLREFYLKRRAELLMPKTLVAYSRQAFVFGPGSVRVTIDTNIRTHPQSVAFFDRDAYRLDPNTAGFSLLEVKFDRFLPDVIREAIQTNAALISYSKFEACRRFDG